MKQPASIFNDVLGPVMIGPSSSHTAASVRIGYLLRAMCDNKPQKAVFEFSRQGSLAFCHEGQGTDMGLAGGLLGLAMDDSRIAEALQLAREAGLNIEFVITDEPVAHPNTYVARVEGGWRKLSATFISSGGGMIELQSLNGQKLAIDGGRPETLLVDGHTILLPQVLPIQSFPHYQGLFNTAAEIEQLAREQNLQLWQIAALYEARRGYIGETEVFERMRRLLHIMRQAIARAEHAPANYADRILGPQAHLLAGARQLPNQVLNTVLQRITLLMEAKSSLAVIVAAPTAGSCAALPGTVIGAAESLGLDEEEMVKALLAAGMIGVLLAEHATFAAEVGGCQAECGSGSGMAAAALVQLLGGSVEQCLGAASMALQNIFGMVCDPVAARVEVPCLGRNILAGANAISMANLALAGFNAVIPLDETIAAMHQVGQSIDSRLRCTCGGGLSQTPTARKIERQLADNKKAAQRKTLCREKQK